MNKLKQLIKSKKTVDIISRFLLVFGLGLSAFALGAKISTPIITIVIISCISLLCLLLGMSGLFYVEKRGDK